MDTVIQQSVVSAAVQLEKQLDSEIDKLENLDLDDLESLRQQRIKDLKKQSMQKKEWLSQGHGQYTELADEKEFFEVSKKSPNIVCHFYRNTAERCKIVDKHLQILAAKHVEAKFCKVNAEKSPFLTQRLRIKVIPTIALIEGSKTKDFIVGFTDLGNRDDFSTEILEWRMAQSGAIAYNGDLMTPPDEVKKQKQQIYSKNKGIRSTCNDSDGSDFDD